MNSQNRTWESLKTQYLHQVEKALSLVNHSRSKDVLDEVSSHLDRRFAELSADNRTWENFQAIITDMGPPCEYAELLDTGQPLKKQRPSLKFIVLVVVVLGIGVAAILILPKLYQPDQDSSQTQQPDPDAFEIQRRTFPHPFVNDPRILGNWESVDLVRFVGDFEPGTRQKQGELFLKNLNFMKNGRSSLPDTWTKGWIWHSNGKTKAQYEIKVIDGEHYLFFPWLGGSVPTMGHKPVYYVLKKVSSAKTPRSDTQGSAKKPAIDTTINVKVAQLNMDTATLDDVIRIFGEPERYSLWNNETFTKDNLPSVYIAWYSGSFRVLMSNGKISELRFAQPGIGYIYKGKLQIGSSLEEAFDVLGKPSKTVVGQPMGVEDGVLYKDINGRKGHCCYMRADQKVRLFFSDYKVSGIYLSRNKYPSPGQREKRPREQSETNTKEICHDQTV